MVKKRFRTIDESSYPDIRMMYERGESINAIARAYEKDHSVINYHLKKMGAWHSPTRLLKPPKRVIEKKVVCDADGCEKRPVGRGLCRNHYNLAWKYHRLPNVSLGYNPYPIRCDHSTSRCQCINPGRDYRQYMKENRSRG